MHLLVPAALLLATACAHGDHGSGASEPAIPADANWMTKHMAGKFPAYNQLPLPHSVSPTPQANPM